MLKLNNKQERLKTISSLPKQKLSMKWIKTEFKILIDYIESRVYKKDQKNVYKYDIPLDNQWYKEINYCIIQRLEFSFKDGKCVITQLPVAAFIYKNTLEEEDYWFYYKGWVSQKWHDMIYAREIDDWKEPQGRSAEMIEYRLDIYEPDSDSTDKCKLLFQIPYFKKFYKLLKKQNNLSYIDFKEYVTAWSDNPIVETSIKEGWFNLLNNCHWNGKTVNQMLLLENETKQFARRVIDFYGKCKTFKTTIFKDALEIGREHIPDWSDDMLFESWTRVKQLHEEAMIIDGKITSQMQREANIKKLELQKFLDHKRFNTKLIQITKPSSKRDVKKAGQEMNNCIGTYNPKNIYLVYIIKGDKKYMVGVEWKPEDEKFKQLHSYNNWDLPNNWRQNIIKNIKEVRNGSKEN